MTPLRVAVLPLLACACLWGGGEGRPRDRVEDPSIRALAERLDAFYSRLEKLRLDTVATFEDAEFRSYFLGDREFTDYYARLASQIRRAQFRAGQATRVQIREFRLDADGLAIVDVALIGRHERGLRFWEIQIERTDVWRRVGGTWFVTPDKL